MSKDEHRMLERLAYESWVRRGRPIGSADVDWEEATKAFSAKRDSHESDSEEPGSMPTDLSVHPIPELSHAEPIRRRRDS